MSTHLTPAQAAAILDAADAAKPHATPQEAAAAVRLGRRGWVIVVRRSAGWIAHSDYLPITKTEAVMLGRTAMEYAAPERVKVLDADGTELRVPVPQHLRARKGGAAT